MGEKPEGSHSSMQSPAPHPLVPKPHSGLGLCQAGPHLTRYPSSSVPRPGLGPAPHLLFCFPPQHFPPSDLPGIYIIDHLIFKLPLPPHTHPCNWNIHSIGQELFLSFRSLLRSLLNPPCLTHSGCSATILEWMDLQESSSQPSAPGFQLPQLCKLESCPLPALDEISGREADGARHCGGEDRDAGL